MANWFIRSSSAGAGNGTNWNNAWSIANLNSSWASVNPGDIIWMAGGNYSGSIHFTKDGAAGPGNYIYVKRATTGDVAATGATGWDPAFDSQVIIGPTTDITPMLWPSSSGLGSYVSIDGRTESGISCQYDNSEDAFLGAVAFGGAQHDIILDNLDLAGPGGAAPFNYQGDNAPIMMRCNTPVYNITISHCNLHGGPNLIYSYPNGGNHHITIEYCRFYDNASSNPSMHGNMIYNEQAHDWTIRYCDFSGWQVEGILLFNVGASAVYYIYGNIFHDPENTEFTTCFWPGSNTTGAAQGTVYLYNNTFVGVRITSTQSRSWQFGSGSIARNNIYWDATFASNSVIADSDYNFSNASGPGTSTGSNSITNGNNPFVSDTDFHIIGTSGSTWPRNNGVSLGSPYNTDFDGNARGMDAGWDMGAYEFPGTHGVVIRGSPMI